MALKPAKTGFWEQREKVELVLEGDPESPDKQVSQGKPMQGFEEANLFFHQPYMAPSPELEELQKEHGQQLEQLQPHCFSRPTLGASRE